MPGSGAGSGGGGPAAGGSGGGAVLAGIGWALQTAHRAGSALAGRMEQTAGHAGMHGAYPYSTVGSGGARRIAPPRYGQAPQAPGAVSGTPGVDAAPPEPRETPGIEETPGTDTAGEGDQS